MKKIFKDENEKRAAILTALTMFILFTWMFFHTAFTYQDPPEEYGMEVNFGTTDTGQGDNQTAEPIKMQPNVAETPEEPVEEVVAESTPVEEVVETPVEEAVEVPTEDVITEETPEEVPVIETSETPVDVPVEEVTPVEAPVEEVKPVEETPKPVAETPTEPTEAETPKTNPAPPKPDASTENALLNVLNGPPANGTSSGNEGDDNENGDPNAPDYYTNPGNGSGGDYDIIGRIWLKRPYPTYACEQEGRVVVAIKVGRDGKVISATPGVKGSTTTDPCLLNKAKEAALKTKLNKAANAPEQQVGKIIYNFSLQ